MNRIPKSSPYVSRRRVLQLLGGFVGSTTLSTGCTPSSRPTQGGNRTTIIQPQSCLGKSFEPLDPSFISRLKSTVRPNGGIKSENYENVANAVIDLALEYLSGKLSTFPTLYSSNPQHSNSIVELIEKFIANNNSLYLVIKRELQLLNENDLLAYILDYFPSIIEESLTKHIKDVAPDETARLIWENTCLVFNTDIQFASSKRVPLDTFSSAYVNPGPSLVLTPGSKHRVTESLVALFGSKAKQIIDRTPIIRGNFRLSLGTGDRGLPIINLQTIQNEVQLWKRPELYSSVVDGIVANELFHVLLSTITRGDWKRIGTEVLKSNPFCNETFEGSPYRLEEFLSDLATLLSVEDPSQVVLNNFGQIYPAEPNSDNDHSSSIYFTYDGLRDFLTQNKKMNSTQADKMLTYIKGNNYKSRHLSALFIKYINGDNRPLDVIATSSKAEGDDLVREFARFMKEKYWMFGKKIMQRINSQLA